MFRGGMRLLGVVIPIAFDDGIMANLITVTSQFIEQRARLLDSNLVGELAKCAFKRWGLRLRNLNLHDHEQHKISPTLHQTVFLTVFPAP